MLYSLQIKRRSSLARFEKKVGFWHPTKQRKLLNILQQEVTNQPPHPQPHSVVAKHPGL